MIRRIFLIFLLLAASILSAPNIVSADGAHKPPPITIVLYLESQGPAGEPAQPLLDLRDHLRSNDRLEALVFSPDSPTFILAARNANPPISLDSVTNFDTRLALAQAVDAQFALMAAPVSAGSDRMDLRLFEIKPISRSWSFTSLKAKDAAKAVADQVIRAASEKAPPPATPSAVPAGTPSTPAGNGNSAPAAQVAPPVEHSPNPAPPAKLPTLPVVVGPSNTLPPPVAHPVPVNPVPQSAPPPTKPAPALAAPNLPVSPQTQPKLEIVAPPPAKPAITLPPAKPAITPPPQPKPAITTPPPPAQPAITTPPVQSAQQPAPQKAVVPPAPVQATPPVNSVSPPQESAPAPQESGPPAAQPTADAALATESPVAAPPQGPTLNDAAIGKMSQGDTAMQQSDVFGAIQFYREAVDEAPRAAEPRMRLIQAYLQAGLKDQALDEERRALMLDPNNTDLQNMLKSQTTDGTLPGADLAIRQAAVSRDPNDEAAWIVLGDSYWNSGQPDQALKAYEKAARLKPGDVAAQAHLARLYAATSQYEKSLDALSKAGPQGYPYALRIIAARTDSLIADIESAHDAFRKGDITREQFYDSLKKADNQSQALAQFVGKITPPAEYNVAYLHRRLATNLLAQATAEWLNFIETNDDQFSQQAALWQSEAAQEMKTASIAERLQSSLSAVSH